MPSLLLFQREMRQAQLADRSQVTVEGAPGSGLGSVASLSWPPGEVGGEMKSFLKMVALMISWLQCTSMHHSPV